MITKKTQNLFTTFTFYKLDFVKLFIKLDTFPYGLITAQYGSLGPCWFYVITGEVNFLF